MFERLARFMYRRRWWVVGVWVVILLVAATGAAQVGSVLGPGNFTLPNSDSQKAAQILQHQFHQDDQRVVITLLQNPTLTYHDARFQAAAASLVTRIRADQALQIQTLDNPIVSNNQQFLARNGHAIAIVLSSALKEQDIEAQIDHLRSVARTPGFTTYVVGTPALNHDYAVGSKDDLSLGESVTVPILILILLFVFGTLVAALLPLTLAAFSIVLSLALVYIFGHTIDTSVYVTNVVTVLGLGIGIDYTLFLVYRFREELRAGNGDVERAVVRTMTTTGRAVFFSGLTVAIGLASLVLTQLTFLESMGLGGMVVPATSVLVALTLLPAILGLLGPRVNRLRPMTPIERLFRRGPRTIPSDATTEGYGFWHNLAMTVMRRPIVSGGIVLVLLLALIFPARNLTFAFGSLKNAPQSMESVKGYLYMQNHFATLPDPTDVVIQPQGTGTLLQPRTVAGIRALEARLRQDPGALRVIGPAEFLQSNGQPTPATRGILFSRFLTPDRRYAIVSITGRNEVGTKGAEDLVKRTRDIVNGFAAGALSGTTMHVGGAQASYTDFNDAMYSKFPLIVAIVLLLSYIFLFFAFRSIFLPLKAVLLNLLSVGASFGMLVLVFQGGVGSTLLDFHAESGVASWVPIFLFAFLFGLSMDYEVFLLSRIRERWLQTGDNRGSVAFGLERTGQLITSAAAVMVIAFSGFLLGHQIQLKEFGFGMLAAVAVDATLIRVVLVPSIMELLGHWNWWVPQSLRAFSRRGASLEGESIEQKEPVTA